MTTPSADDLRDLRAWLRWRRWRGSAEVSTRDVMRAGPRRLRTSQAAQDALQALVSNGDGTWVLPARTGPGRPPAPQFIAYGDGNRGGVVSPLIADVDDVRGSTRAGAREDAP